MDAIFTLPVAILRAAFCMVWILLREEGGVLGNQIGAQYVKSERMSDLYVMISVSVCWPHDVPERAFSILRRGVARVMSDCMCGLNVR